MNIEISSEFIGSLVGLGTILVVGALVMTTYAIVDKFKNRKERKERNN
jgi:hypothetical protein